MTSIKKISISGFRGILNPLTIDFASGGKCQSVIIYGANGTGKSSITDAWEWLTTGKIQHLALEGAEEGAYPHMTASSGASFVEVEFSAPEIGLVRLDFDHARITKPNIKGNLSEARRQLADTCHIRYADLTRFVFLRKAQRYDALASLMGFVPQMEYQKALRRVQKSFLDEVSVLRQIKGSIDERFKNYFHLPEVQIDLALDQLVKICANHNIATDPTIENVKNSRKKLQSVVENDPMAKKLAGYQTLELSLKSCVLQPKLVTKISNLRDAIGQVKAEQKEQLGTQLLIPVFQSAKEFLSKIDSAGQCPLCGSCFDGDLREHVINELAKMKYLKQLLDNLKTHREELSKALYSQKSLVQTLDEMLDGLKPEKQDDLLQKFRSAANGVDDLKQELIKMLSFDSTSLTDELVSEIKYMETSLGALESTFNKAKDMLLRETDTLKTLCGNDSARIQLVADVTFINQGLVLINDNITKTVEFEKAQRISGEYSVAVNDYVSKCVSNVQKRFDEISDLLKIYFEILEQNSQGLGAPKLNLLPDQERSVVLEVYFHGKTIHPAYKYLSESQLTSFGLAVFLATATYLNKECQFLILDDIVNSFDSYKRPLVIDLIKKHFQDYQILLLTHDKLFRDNLHRKLPSWKRINFTSYTFGVGPTVFPALQTLEKVEDALKRDEAEEAFRTLGQYMEDTLQDIAEKFECVVKFNRSNEYTLDTLLDRFRIRVSKKLGKDHPLTEIIDELHKDNFYRNWATHSKNPQTSIHKNEVQDVLRKWQKMESYVICTEEKCHDILKYDGKGAFVCRCGKTRL